MKNDVPLNHNIQAEEKIKSDVKKYGWHVALFEETDNEPSFAYSIGFWQTFGHPEIIIFGLSLENLHTLINTAGEKIKDSKKLEIHEDDFDFLEEFPVQFISVSSENFKDYFGYGMWFYNYQPFPALQLIWPDKNGFFPWHEGCDKKMKSEQPLMDKGS